MSTMKNNYMTGKRAAGALVFLATMLVSGVAFAAGGGGDHHGFPWGKFAASWVNFAIFAAMCVVAILALFLATPPGHQPVRVDSDKEGRRTNPDAVQRT